MSALRLTNWLTKSLLRFRNVKNLKQVSLRYYADDSRVTKGLVIGLYQKEGEKEPKLTSSGEKFDDRVQGKVTELIKETNLSGKLGKENVHVEAGVGSRSLQMQGFSEVFVDSMEYPEQAAEGSALPIWRYQDNKRKKDRKVLPKLELYRSPHIDAWTRGLFKAEAQNLARRLSGA